MSSWCAWVGEIIIKSELRADFGYLFRGEYDKIENGPIADYVKRWKNDMLPLCHWKHYDFDESWKGKYKTSYDEETDFFTYGVSYNRHGVLNEPMMDMYDLLEEITEEEASYDFWDEAWYT